MDNPIHSESPLQQTLNSAISGYRAKHTTATEEQVKEFTEKVQKSLEAKNGYREGKVEPRRARRERRIRVNELAKSLEVKTLRARQIIEAVIGKIRTPVGLSPVGGLTIAYKLEKDNVYNVSVAICNSTEPFDILAGRELAVERFSQGLTIQVESIGEARELDPNVIRKQYVAFLQQAKPALAS